MRAASLPGWPQRRLAGTASSIFFGMRQVEVLHVADEVALADLAAQPRIELLLLGDAGGGEPAIVVRRIEQAGLGQREDARPHRAVERARVALLEVGAARAADHDAVAGEGHALVVEHVGDAAVGVAGRGAHFQRAAAELDAVAVAELAVDARGAGRGREGDAAAELLLQQPGAGHVVGMDVGVERPQQLQPELADQRRVAADLLEHRVDQHALRARPSSPADRCRSRRSDRRAGGRRAWAVAALLGAMTRKPLVIPSVSEGPLP